MDGIQKRKGGRLTEAFIRSRYPQVIEGSLALDEQAVKQSVLIGCAHEGCNETRRVFTSDLFQVSMCEDHAHEARKARKAAKKAALKAQAPVVVVTA
jgi:hypothetical protein